MTLPLYKYRTYFISITWQPILFQRQLYVERDSEGYHLNFLLQEKYERRINLGIRFDSEEIASLLVNATADLKTHIPSRLALTGRLGKRYAARIDYTLEPMQQRNFNFSYMFQYNDINIYEEGDRAYNTTYKYHLAEFGFSDVWYKNFRFDSVCVLNTTSTKISCSRNPKSPI